MVTMVFTSSPLIAQSLFVKRLRTNSKYSGSSWVTKSSIKVSSCVQQLSYKNISVESSKSSFIQGDGFSAFSLPKSSRVLPISKSPSLNASLPPGPGGDDVFKKSIYRFTAKQNGIDKAFKEYQEKILLIVNIPEQSSQWTNSQIKYLNDLYAKYKKKGFEIIGFPYDKKDTQGDTEIDNSVEITKEEEIIKPQFPVFDKVVLNDEHKVKLWFLEYIDQKKRKKDVWYFLKQESPVDRGVDVTQAFQKFLVDSRGVPTSRFPPFPVPHPAEFKDPVEEAIKEYFPEEDERTSR